MKELDEIQKLRLSLILDFITEFYEEKMVNIKPKPKPKPDVVLYASSKNYEKNGIAFITNGYIRYENIFPLKEYSKPNIKLTYDGETNELKSVEKI